MSEPRTPPPAPQPNVLPLVIGVTGHRQLREQDRGRLKDLVREFFRHLKNRHPHTPLLLLSSLAEGADQLVAAVAVDEDYAKLIVPLPMDVDLYERDFHPAGAAKDAGETKAVDPLADFRRLLSQAQSHFVVPIVAPPRQREVIVNDGEPRNLQYALAGAYVARHCQILLALWDGKDDQGLSGTAQVVRFKRSGTFPVAAPLARLLETVEEPFGLPHDQLEAPETGPVYHIVVTRKEDAKIPANSFSVDWLPPQQYECKGERVRKAYRTYIHQVHRHLDEFNQFVGRLMVPNPEQWQQSPTGKRWQQSQQELLAQDQADRLAPSLRSLRDTFATADLMAIGFQKWSWRALLGLLGLVFLAAVFFGLYGHLVEPPEDMVWLAAYAMALLGAGLVYFWANWFEVRDRHQDYRTLAEGLRVQFYWRLAGLRAYAAHHYLEEQKSELDWIRQALQTWGVQTEPEAVGDVETVRTQWLEGAWGQRDYYRKKTGQHHRKAVAFAEVSDGFLLASLGLAACALTQPHTDTLPLVLAICFWFSLLAGNLFFKLKDLWLRTSAEERWPEIFRHLGFLLLGLALGLGLTGVVLGCRYLAVHEAAGPPGREGQVSGEVEEASSFPKGWMVVFIGLTAVVGVLLKTYSQQNAFADHSKQYREMDDVFTRAIEQLLAVGASGPAATEVLKNLGEKALAEHGKWIILHRERPLEPPQPPA